MLVRFVASSIHLLAASLAVGVGLSFAHINHAVVLAYFGLTPDQFVDLLMNGVYWAIPKIGLGALFVIPVWLMLNLFRPPKGFE
jgi:hypothetical protein